MLATSAIITQQIYLRKKVQSSPNLSEIRILIIFYKLLIKKRSSFFLWIDYNFEISLLPTVASSQFNNHFQSFFDVYKKK